MDKIEKALRKLSAKELGVIKHILECLRTGRLVGLDVQKLHGPVNIFRVRKGKIRIIYRMAKEEILILAIERRSEKTYRAF